MAKRKIKVFGVDPPPEDEKPFLAAIAAAFDDDAPRLVFADWLDERGDPRGQQIRRSLVRFSETHWEMIYGVLRDFVYMHGDGPRINFGRYSYPLHQDPKRAAAGAFKDFQDKVNTRTWKARMEIIHKYRLWCCDEWYQIIHDIFGTKYLPDPLAEVIKRKVKARMMFKEIGTNARDLAHLVDDLIMDDLCGGAEHSNHDPQLVPNAAALLKSAVENFDPWEFDWSRVDIRPTLAQRLQTAGFIFRSGIKEWKRRTQ